MNPTMLTIEQLSQRLQLSRSTICRRIDDGTLPRPAKIGGAIRFRISDVEAFERGAVDAHHERTEVQA